MRGIFAIAVVVMCVQITRVACGCNGDERIDGRDRPMQTQKKTRVVLGPTRLQYFEDDNRLILFVEPAHGPEGFYYIVYVPNSERWTRTMPEWARHRRDEIVAEIKRLTADRPIKWVE